MANPLYPKVVAGFEPNERGEDAVALADLLARTAGGAMRQVHIERGSAGRGLQRLAEQGEADLLVLGSTHRAAFGRVAPGSVAEHLLGGAPCRIAIAPRGYTRARAVLAAENAGEEADDVPEGTPLPFVRDRFRVIEVGFTGSVESRAALKEAAELAGRAGSTLRLHGVSAPAPTQLGPQAAAFKDFCDAFQAELQHAAAALPPELRALPIHERGDPVERLLARAAEGVDLLVLGSRGFGPLLRLMLGSVSAEVIRDAPCPVLITPRVSQSAPAQTGHRPCAP